MVESESPGAERDPRAHPQHPCDRWENWGPGRGSDSLKGCCAAPPSCTPPFRAEAPISPAVGGNVDDPQRTAEPPTSNGPWPKRPTLPKVTHASQVTGQCKSMKHQPLYHNLGQLCGATLAPELPVGSAEAFVVAALQFSFLLCSVLLSSFPVGVDPERAPQETRKALSHALFP